MEREIPSQMEVSFGDANFPYKRVTPTLFLELLLCLQFLKIISLKHANKEKYFEGTYSSLLLSNFGVMCPEPQHHISFSDMHPQIAPAYKISRIMWDIYILSPEIHWYEGGEALSRSSGKRRPKAYRCKSLLKYNKGS